MALIKNKFYVNGDIPTAALLNQPYDNLVSTSINDDNTGDKWANREHLKTSVSAKPINLLFDFDYDGSTPWNIPTTFTDVENIGGSPTLVNPNYTTTNDAILRWHVSGLIGEIDMDTDGNSGAYSSNIYTFRLQCDINSVKTDLAYVSYSLTQKAAITTNNASASARKPINFRSFGFSGIKYIAPGALIENVRLQAETGLATNIIPVQHNHLQVIIAEN